MLSELACFRWCVWETVFLYPATPHYTPTGSRVPHPLLLVCWAIVKYGEPILCQDTSAGNLIKRY